MLQGTYSHEPPGFLSLFPLIRTKHPIQVADRLQQIALNKDGDWIASEGWQFDKLPDEVRLLCTCIPTLNRGALAAAVGALATSAAMGDQLELLLSGYAESHLSARGAGIPVALLSHGTVHGCITEHGVAMAGADHEFTSTGLFAAQATAVMLGHIHKHQVWMDGARAIAYAGSVGRLHYGEAGEKGFLLWDMESDAANPILHPTPARRTVDIVFDGPPDMDKLIQFADSHCLDNLWVRIRWEVLEEERDVVDRARIEEVLAGAAGLKLEGRVIPVIRARAAGIARELSLPRQIERWATSTGVDAPQLLSCLEQLHGSSPEAIAARIFQRQTPTLPVSDEPALLRFNS
jgi:exonuclease SbcD